jgi:hypothetical protein
MSIVWNTGAAAMRFRLKNKKKKKASSAKLQANKLQASSFKRPGTGRNVFQQKNI